ncbi:uncharacterized protein RHO25_003109 [Cercospora beticola]|uniref:Uncharacterized protein n=1 Tax=Cercospora beticola TaxID=122368 RepID=A0ABZ0NG47_CERBT|nr:hypothetical protein RHO25_003109 [Cercospora beticola]CAK1359756.1 unnamed protein product [Cercospora beticola]
MALQWARERQEDDDHIQEFKAIIKESDEAWHNLEKINEKYEREIKKLEEQT